MIMRIIDTPSLEPFILKVIILKHNPQPLRYWKSAVLANRQGNLLAALELTEDQPPVVKCIGKNGKLNTSRSFCHTMCVFSPSSCVMQFFQRKCKTEGHHSPTNTQNIYPTSFNNLKGEKATSRVFLTFKFEINFVSHFRHDRMNHSSWGWRISSHPSSTGKTVKTRTWIL